MKWLYFVKYKTRAIAGLSCILLVIILGNLLVRERFDKLDKSMTSIWNDRLKPTVYIYEISKNLYQKRLLVQEKGISTETTSQLAAHNSLIASHIASYEKTYLTPDEKTEWNDFKKHITNYSHLELAALKGGTAQNSGALEKEFNLAIDNLNRLSQIQIGEGNLIQKNTKSVVSNSIAFSSLEMALLIVLSLFTLIVLSVSDKRLFQQHQRQILN
ncbi:MAG TPA: MCP four helix bundle domain-containing protein [Flavipsychrobacter sp.]|nr:MCP four helix bundle domain-containing protein [Flavipsychrobacter sp.]